MKKIYLTIILICVFILSINAQNFSSLLIQDSNDKIVNNLLEDNKSYVISGMVNGLNRYNGYILKIDSMGQIVNSSIYADSVYDLAILSSLKTSDSYVFIGTKSKNQVYSNSFLWVLITDTNLNKKFEKFYLLDSAFNVTTYNTSIIGKKDSNIYIAGYYFKNPYEYHSYLYKLNINGDLLNSKINDFQSTNSLFFQMLESDTGMFKVSAVAFFSNGPNQIVEFDDSLNYIGYSVIDDNTRLGAFGLSNLDRSNYLALYNSNPNNTGERDVLLCKINAQNDSVVSKLNLGVKDTDDCAGYRGISVYSKNIYTGFTKNCFYGDIYYGNGNSSQLVAVKTDTNLTVLWEKSFSLNGYYLRLAVVKATSDKGCLLMASAQDINSSLNHLDIYIIKLDSTGQTTWVKNISIPKTDITIFPNPASTIININLQSLNKYIAKLKVYNSIGQEVYFIKPNKKDIQIDVRSFKSGVYFINGICKNGDRFSSKFVKE